jgi:phytoene dehydrogenase-like protein
MVAPYPIPRQCAAGYYPETNVLVSIHSVADESHCPASKSIVIALQPSSSQDVSAWEKAGP